MGARGPAKTPSALRALAGDKNAGKGEPQPSSDVHRPDGLNAGALAVWNRLAPDLQRKGVLTGWDVDEFAAYCDAVERRDRACEMLDEHGEVIAAPVFDQNGKRTGERFVLSPWWQVWKAANDITARKGARFGLTPSDRTALKVDDGRSKNPKGRYLTG